jgi:hypothetical protein
MRTKCRADATAFQVPRTPLLKSSFPLSDMLEEDLNHITLEGITAIDSCFADVNILVEVKMWKEAFLKLGG